MKREDYRRIVGELLTSYEAGYDNTSIADQLRVALEGPDDHPKAWDAKALDKLISDAEARPYPMQINVGPRTLASFKELREHRKNAPQNDKTVAAICRMINAILDGKDDEEIQASEPWESTRRRLRAVKQDNVTTVKLHTEVLQERAEALRALKPLEHQVRKLTAEKEGFRQALVAFHELSDKWPVGTRFTIEHDGFWGEVIGYYSRTDGKRGVVGQQVGSKVVHVYGEKWLKNQTPPKG